MEGLSLRWGRNAVTVFEAMERLGAELGRPPSQQEIEGATGLARPALSKALGVLERGGYVTSAGLGYPVQVKTREGAAVTWERKVEVEG